VRADLAGIPALVGLAEPAGPECLGERRVRVLDLVCGHLDPSLGWRPPVAAPAGPGPGRPSRRLDALDQEDQEFVRASEAAYSLLTATIERCRAAGRLHGRSPELVAVSA
jgi:hypothetical protein